MKMLKEAGDLNGKKVLLRADLDVPVSDSGKIEEPFRIQKQKETLDYLVQQEATVVMVGHISAVPSFEPLLPQLTSLLGQDVVFMKSLSDLGTLAFSGRVALLDNVRQNPGEEKNDPEFAKQLAAGFDLYINNAFAVSHRNHASVAGVPKLLPSYAGLQVEAELKHLDAALNTPAEGKIIIMGGAKASTKVPVIKNLIGKSEKILLGGVVANDVLKEKGQDMGSSVVDADAHELLGGLDLQDSRLIVPTDFIVFDNKILDIGDQTMQAYIGMIQKAKMIIWNGPLGLFENQVFAKGTNEIAQAVVASTAVSVIGGGDTISAVDKIGLLNKFGFVSTGGGAMLEYLAGNTLPGLAALS